MINLMLLLDLHMPMGTMLLNRFPIQLNLKGVILPPNSIRINQQIFSLHLKPFPSKFHNLQKRISSTNQLTLEALIARKYRLTTTLRSLVSLNQMAPILSTITIGSGGSKLTQIKVFQMRFRGMRMNYWPSKTRGRGISNTSFSH